MINWFNINLLEDKEYVFLFYKVIIIVIVFVDNRYNVI